MEIMKKLCILLFLPQALSLTVEKTIIFSPNNEWVPLGKFREEGNLTLTGQLLARNFGASNKSLVVYVVSYTAKDWIKVASTIGCISRLQQMHAQYTLSLPTSTSKSSSVKVLFPEEEMYLVATNCFSPDDVQVENKPIKIVVDNCSYEIAESVNTIKNETEVIEELHKSFDYFLEIFNAFAFIILLVNVMITQVFSKKLANSEYMFAFPALVVGVMLRMVMHVLLMVEPLLKLKYVRRIVLSLDLISQYGFFVNSTVTVIGYPLESIGAALISAVIVLGAFILLSLSSTLFSIISCRGLLAIILTISFIYGMKNMLQPKSLKTLAFLTGLLYTLGMMVLEIEVMEFVKVESILLDRVELFVKSITENRGLQVVVELDLMFQAIVMGITVSAVGHYARRV